MPDYTQYDAAFIESLDQQLAVYTTIGTPRLESPMWFQFNRVDYEKETLLFVSSQVSYMFFNLQLKEEDKSVPFDFYKTYDYFRGLKYDHIRNNWPTVYKELRG